MKPIPYGRQQITAADMEAVAEVLRSDFLTQGPAVALFEKKFATYIDAPYAVAVSNGTTALHLAALTLGVQAGSRVITTPNTFVASANCVRYCGGEVWFADIDPDTFLLDVEKVRALIESKPPGFFSGIIPVSFAGYPADLEAFRTLADTHKLWILEDACHSPGAAFTGKNGQTYRSGDGQLADLSVFSFHPVKHIATGEGGMITTRHEAFYQKLRQLRTHGITREPDQLEENHGAWYYEMQELGYNYRLNDIQAALGVTQLAAAEKGFARRQEIAARYDKALAGYVQLPIRAAAIRHAFHLYVIRTPRRKALYDFLRQHQIFCQVHYIPVHLQPYYRNLGWKEGDFPEAEAYYAQCLSLPMYPALTNEEQDYVIQHILEFLQS